MLARGESRGLWLQARAICKLRNSVGPLQYFSVYQGGLCVRLVGRKTGNEDRALTASVNSAFKVFNHQFEGVHHRGGKKKREREREGEKAKQEMQ